VLSVADQVIDYILCNPQQEILCLRRYQNTAGLPIGEFLDKVCIQDETLKYRFQRVDILYQGARWLLVPVEFLPTGTEANYLSQSFSISETRDNFQRELVRPLQLNVVYAIEDLLLRKFDFYFQEYQLHHPVTYLLQYNLTLQEQLKKPYLCHVEIFFKSMLLTIFKSEQLIFCNRFAVNYAEDIFYFILSVFQQLKLPNDQLSLYVTGREVLRKKANELLKVQFSNWIEAQKILPYLPTLNTAGIFAEDILYLMAGIHK
jgi:hypothetical protein